MKKKIAIDILAVKIVQAYNATNIWLKYNWPLNYIDNKVAVNLKLQNIKKY